MKTTLTILSLAVFAILAGCALSDSAVQAAAGANLLKNPSFEEGGSPIPAGWLFENKAKAKGSVAVVNDQAQEGSSSLKLSPNGKNRPPGIANNPLGVGQGFPAKDFLGRTVHISGALAAEGGATAVVGVYALRKNGSVHFVELRQGDSSAFVSQQDSLEIPNDKDFLYVIVNCNAEGESGAARFDNLYFGFDLPPNASAAPVNGSPANRQPETLSAELRIDAGKRLKEIDGGVFGANVEWIWNGNGLWDEKAGRLDETFVGLVEDLGISQIRFPGGIFADFYNWRDGVGPHSARKTNEAMPGGPRSKHNFGTDEALELSRRTGAPLFITANIGTGSPNDAVEWLNYIRERTAQGQVAPATFWEIGNEQYVKDGSPHSKASTLTPARYSEKFLQYAQAIRRADSTVKVGAILDENYGASIPHAYPRWTEEVLRSVGAQADFVSVHNGYAPAVIDPRGRSTREIYASMLAAPILIEKSLKGLDEKLVRFAGDNDRRIRVAVTEWGPFFHLAPDSPYVDHVKTLGSALYVASALKTFISAPRVDMAHFFKLGDELFMGWIGKRDGTWVPKAPYLAFQLMSRHTGDAVVESVCESPTYAAKSVGWVDGQPNVPYVDTMASVSANGRKLFVIAINRHFDEDVPLTINVANATLSGRARVATLSGTGIDANTGTELFRAPGVKWAKQARDDKNPRFDKGGEGEVTVQSQTRNGLRSSFVEILPPASVTALEIDLR